MNLSCYIIDDEHHALEVLKAYIQQTPGLELMGYTTDPISGLHAVNGVHSPDLTFLDIDMPELSGLTLAGLIRLHTTIIFTTSYREYALDAFEQNAVDYLLKPIFYDRFLKSIQKAQLLLAGAVKSKELQGNPETLYVRTGVRGQVRSLEVSEIIYAAAALNYIEIYLKEGRVVTYLSLSELLEKTSPGKFSRIHKSYVVNHAFIQTMEYGQIRLKDKTILPIGRTYRKNFQEKMNEFLLVSKRDHPL